MFKIVHTQNIDGVFFFLQLLTKCYYERRRGFGYYEKRHPSHLSVTGVGTQNIVIVITIGRVKLGTFNKHNKLIESNLN